MCRDLRRNVFFHRKMEKVQNTALKKKVILESVYACLAWESCYLVFKRQNIHQQRGSYVHLTGQSCHGGKDAPDVIVGQPLVRMAESKRGPSRRNYCMGWASQDPPSSFFLNEEDHAILNKTPSTLDHAPQTTITSGH